jgi:hypothetical protein
MTPHEFIAKWKPVDFSERSACQQHFLDLCELFNHDKPAAADPRREASSNVRFLMSIRMVCLRPPSAGWSTPYVGLPIQRGRIAFPEPRRGVTPLATVREPVVRERSFPI